MTDIITSMGAPAALGTGTAEAVISSTFRVPSSARELKAIQPILHTTAPSAAESMFVVVGLRGSDYKKQPLEVFAPIGGAHLGTIGGNSPRDPRWHDVHAPVNGNETFIIYAEALDAMGGNARIGVNFWFTTERSGLPTIKSVCSRETAVGTGAGATNGTAITINGAQTIIEIEGAATNSTVTADEPLSVNISLNSTGIDPNDIDFDVVGDTVEATSGIQTAYVFRAAGLNIPVNSSTIVVNHTHTLRLALTAAGQSGFCIKYI